MTVQGTPTSISAESSSPLQLAEEKTVPEGVQGKEPQTPEFAFTDWYTAYFYGLSALDTKEIARQSFEAGFSEGEAAGRRSAITEFEKWAESQKSGLDEEATGKIMDWCAELQA